MNIDLLGVPTVDLHPIGIMMNNGNFKGSGLDKISGKSGDVVAVLEMYAATDYKGIEEYIKQEAREYIKLYVWLREKMPQLLEEFKKWKPVYTVQNQSKDNSAIRCFVRVVSKCLFQKDLLL